MFTSLETSVPPEVNWDVNFDLSGQKKVSFNFEPNVFIAILYINKLD